MPNKTASRIKDVSYAFLGTAHLYRLNPSLEGHEFIIASSVDMSDNPHLGFIKLSDELLSGSFSSTETYLFPANELGEALNWAELQGSQKDTMDQNKVWADLGYEVVCKLEEAQP